MIKFIIMYEAVDIDCNTISNFCFRSSQNLETLIEEFKSEFKNENIELTKMIVTEVNNTYKVSL